MIIKINQQPVQSSIELQKTIADAMPGHIIVVDAIRYDTKKPFHCLIKTGSLNEKNGTRLSHSTAKNHLDPLGLIVIEKTNNLAAPINIIGTNLHLPHLQWFLLQGYLRVLHPLQVHPVNQHHPLCQTHR